MSDKKQNTALKSAIKESGYTYERLGVKLGITGQTISNAVNGRTPHKNTQKAIAKQLGSTIDELFN